MTLPAVLVPLLLVVSTAARCGCDDLGCLNGVTIRIAEPFDVDELPLEFTTCVDGECETLVESRDIIEPGNAFQSVTFEPFAVTSIKSDDTVTVSIKIRAVATDTVLLDARGNTTLMRSGGGSSCDGDCYQSIVQYDADSNTLVAPGP
jgi:hypothetical protein